jgi:hypothetical protein
MRNKDSLLRHRDTMPDPSRAIMAQILGMDRKGSKVIMAGLKANIWMRGGAGDPDLWRHA